MKAYKQIKALIPNYLKYPFWYIFKSPQRNISKKTLLTDLTGIGIYVLRAFFNKPINEPISICTGIYNRSDNYLNHFLDSIVKMDNQNMIELSVFDCNSNDVENLEIEIRKKWKGKLVFKSEPIKFTRSYSFNKAIHQSSSKMILGCDADIALPPNMVKLCNQYVAAKQTWFPIYFFLYKNKPSVVSDENGEWDQYGSRGLFACMKKDFVDAGAFDESYIDWGNEDIDMWKRFHKSGFIVIRSRAKGLFHKWHTTHNPKYAHMN